MAATVTADMYHLVYSILMVADGLAPNRPKAAEFINVKSSKSTLLSAMRYLQIMTAILNYVIVTHKADMESLVTRETCMLSDL